ncbi:Conserved_hypothetical protein [Hexamita inflata]|uniref:Uncharacterized protein n=1 Tax=Hexamita inflata TaxID=28002 RepID=A0AA86QBZ2_9EUKA|nr:Conserved hypothetical protein [Hexamita inflata]CAI9950237.1 Conserved hypothetical protein [Hexamita inflata]
MDHPTYYSNTALQDMETMLQGKTKSVYRTVLNLLKGLHDRLLLSKNQQIARTNYWSQAIDDAKKINYMLTGLIQTYGDTGMERIVSQSISNLIKALEEQYQLCNAITLSPPVKKEQIEIQKPIQQTYQPVPSFLEDLKLMQDNKIETRDKAVIQTLIDNKQFDQNHVNKHSNELLEFKVDILQQFSILQKQFEQLKLQQAPKQHINELKILNERLDQQQDQIDLLQNENALLKAQLDQIVEHLIEQEITQVETKQSVVKQNEHKMSYIESEKRPINQSINTSQRSIKIEESLQAPTAGIDLRQLKPSYGQNSILEKPQRTDDMVLIEPKLAPSAKMRKTKTL